MPKINSINKAVRQNSDLERKHTQTDSQYTYTYTDSQYNKLVMISIELLTTLATVDVP